MNNKTISGMKCMFYLLGSLVIALPAQAASFDCAKAATKVEKLICGDAELSKLDEELSAAYKEALQDKQQAEAIKRGQKQWMKERNGCSDAVCLRGAYEDRMHGLAHKSTDNHEPVDSKVDKAASTLPYILVMSKNKELCESMLGLYNADINAYGRINYSAHEIFSRIDWQSVQNLEIERANFDINNDGKNEIVIKLSGQVLAAYVESLYIYPEDSDIFSMLKPGNGGLSALFKNPNQLFSSNNNIYYLKDLPESLQEGILAYKLKHLPKYLKNVNINDLRRDLGKAYIAGSFVLQPFIWHETTYISMTNRNPEWIVIGKYRQAEEMQDVCYLYDHSHKFINY